MSIQIKNQIRELTERIERLERRSNIQDDVPRNIAGQPEPDHQPKKRGRPKKGS